MLIPLFVCHANCCRSVLAHYLYRNLCHNAEALSAGIEAGDQINDRAEAMLRHWGIDASRHRPRQLNRDLCLQADAIFVMSPEYQGRLLSLYGADLAAKTYLFADPFSLPASFRNNEYVVYDPSFDERPIEELVQEYSWFRERVAQIHEALHDQNDKLMPATQYLSLLCER